MIIALVLYFMLIYLDYICLSNERRAFTPVFLVIRYMMTSSNGTIPALLGICARPQWIPHTKANDAELWCFSLICVWIDGWVNNGQAGDLRRYRAHYDVTVMMKYSGMRSKVIKE